MPKTRMQPIHRPHDPSMLHRIEMDVIDVPQQIEIVADRMFPVAPLPDTSLPSREPHVRSTLRLGDAAAEIRFDAAPAGRKVGIAFRQSPDPMHMLRQHHPRDHREWSTHTLQRDAVAQVINIRRQQIVTATLQQIHREEPCPARRPVASIIRHTCQHARVTICTTSANNPSPRQKTPSRNNQA